MSEFDKPRHFLIVKRHGSGTIVGFLCHDGDVVQWQKSMEWGEIVSSHPIAFSEEDAPPSAKDAAVARLHEALDKICLRAGREIGEDVELMHGIEQLIGLAYEAGRAAPKPKRRGKVIRAAMKRPKKTSQNARP